MCRCFTTRYYVDTRHSPPRPTWDHPLGLGPPSSPPPQSYGPPPSSPTRNQPYQGGYSSPQPYNQAPPNQNWSGGYQGGPGYPGGNGYQYNAAPGYSAPQQGPGWVSGPPPQQGYGQPPTQGWGGAQGQWQQPPPQQGELRSLKFCIRGSLPRRLRRNRLL